MARDWFSNYNMCQSAKKNKTCCHKAICTPCPAPLSLLQTEILSMNRPPSALTTTAVSSTHQQDKVRSRMGTVCGSLWVNVSSQYTPWWLQFLKQRISSHTVLFLSWKCKVQKTEGLQSWACLAPFIVSPSPLCLSLPRRLRWVSTVSQHWQTQVWCVHGSTSAQTLFYKGARCVVESAGMYWCSKQLSSYSLFIKQVI